MTIPSLLRIVPAALVLLSGPYAFAAAEFDLGKDGALRKITVDKDQISFDESLGGFSARDAKTNATIDFSKGTTKKLDDKTTFDAGDGLRLHAEFVPKDGYLQVNGYLENSAKDDRAIILEYRLGLTGKDAVFSNSLNHAEDFAIGGKVAESEGNAFPVAALTAGKQTVAIALPPLDPRIFGVAGNAKGLAVRFYLGITPVTKVFPNRAPFSFIVYPSAPGWGFRGALEKYYGFFPELYEAKKNKLGFFLCMAKGVLPENIDQYSVNVIEEQSPHIEADLKRDDAHHVASLLYTLVGQREIKFLPKLPADYDEALDAFAHWTPESQKDFPITKENIVAGSDKWLKEEVESSAVKGPDGKYVIVIRDTPWGKKSVAFKSNPSPYLFADKDVPTIGKVSTRLLDEWIRQYPSVDGVIVDSLGANWPATPNYRRDHFAYTQYPLTFDSQGRLFLHNETSHYEWVRYEKEKLEAQGKLLFANGIYTYLTKIPEHYLARDAQAKIKVGRFFVSALLDGSTSEAGTRATTERIQDVRIMMGRKFGNLTNVDWQDSPERVEQFYNRALAYGIFASNVMKYGGNGEYVEGVNEGIPYLNSKDGYYRYKDLSDWFLAQVILLNKPGWHPETNATVIAGGNDNVHLERFGSGNDIYFTLFNDSDQKTDATVKFDFKALGVTEGSANFEEIARKAKVDAVDADQARLTLDPHKTYILSLSKTWLWGKAY